MFCCGALSRPSFRFFFFFFLVSCAFFFFEVKAIDLVVLNLYPFEATVAKGSGFDTCIENIDIGGPSMLRR